MIEMEIGFAGILLCRLVLNLLFALVQFHERRLAEAMINGASLAALCGCGETDFVNLLVEFKWLSLFHALSFPALKPLRAKRSQSFCVFCHRRPAISGRRARLPKRLSAGSAGE